MKSHLVLVWCPAFLLVFENALGICSEEEKSVVYTGMGMAQSKYNIQEAITSFFKGYLFVAISSFVFKLENCFE